MGFVGKMQGAFWVAVQLLSSSTKHELLLFFFLDGLYPEMKSEVFALGITQLPAQFLSICFLERFQIGRDSARQMNHKVSRTELVGESILTRRFHYSLDFKHDSLESRQAVDLMERIESQGPENGKQNFGPNLVQGSFESPQTSFPRLHLHQYLSQNIRIANLSWIPDSCTVLQ
jgi:hypothetical protein